MGSRGIFFHVFSTLKEGVAGGGERLRNASIAAPFRWKGCVKGPAARAPAGAEALTRGWCN
jgi:hypothetical protein